MSGRPRKDVIREDEVGVYHVWMRCVRRMFLCGIDPLTGRDYRERKQWFKTRLEELSRVFAVDACIWAILSNHYHLIVRNRPDLARQWSDEEVVRRWWYLCPERRDEDGRPAEPTPLEIRSLLRDRRRVAKLRKRLSSISWFMKSINEWFSKRANASEDQHGHFWEDRFGCRNLLDEGAILACSIYVDLNEVRAKLASLPENSRDTSAYVRILARLLRRERMEAKRMREGNARFREEFRASDPDFWLCPINVLDRAPLLGVPGTATYLASNEDPWRSERDGASVDKTWRHGFLPMGIDEYLSLLDYTGRQMVEGKPGVIDERYAPILKRLGIQPEAWFTLLENFETWFHGAAGRAENMAEFAAATGREWIQGVSHSRRCFQ